MKKLLLLFGFLSLLLTPFTAHATLSYVGSCAQHNYTTGTASCNITGVGVGDIVVVGYGWQEPAGTDVPYGSISDAGGTGSATFIAGNYFNGIHNTNSTAYGTQFIYSFHSNRADSGSGITYSIVRTPGSYNVTDIHVYVYHQSDTTTIHPVVDEGASSGFGLTASSGLFGSHGSTQSVVFGLFEHGYTLGTPTMPGGEVAEQILAPFGASESVSIARIYPYSFSSADVHAPLLNSGSPVAYDYAVSGLVIYFLAGAATTTTTASTTTTTTTSTTSTTSAGTTTTTTSTTTTITVVSAPPCAEVHDPHLTDCNDIPFYNLGYNLQGSVGDNIAPTQGAVLFNSGPLASAAPGAIAYSITTSGTPGYRATLRYFDAYCTGGTATITIKDGATTVWTTKTGAVSTTLFMMPFPILTGTANNDLQVSLGTCGGSDVGHLQVIGDASP